MQKIAEIVGIAFLAFVAVSLAYFGCLWVFTPEVQLEKLAITVSSIPGISALRSVLSSGLLTFAALCVLFIINREQWFKPLLIFSTLLLIARLISLALDGLNDRMIMFAVLEALIIVDLFLLKKLQVIRPRKE